jgi:hypothetical protein
MDELAIFDKLSTSGSPMAIALAIMYFARQLKTSINHLELTIESMKKSLTDLNLTLTKLIVERDGDRKDIDEIKLDLRSLSERVKNGNS